MELARSVPRFNLFSLPLITVELLLCGGSNGWGREAPLGGVVAYRAFPWEQSAEKYVGCNPPNLGGFIFWWHVFAVQ